MPHLGACLCGNVTYKLSAEPLGARICWCRDCQRIASGSPTVNVLFPAEAFSASGDLGGYIREADSGNTVERGFCRQCGSQIYSRTLAPVTDLPIRIRAGTLDDPTVVTPEAHIWVDSAPVWASFAPGLPKFARGPGSAAVE